MQTSQENNKSAHRNSTPHSELLEITRDFSAPVEKLFAAFKSPAALKAWWWPKDLYADHVELDFREGGRFFVNMKGYDRGGGGATGEFEEIVENRRIVMTDHFADDEGHPISAEEAKMPGIWPDTLYITLEFASLGEGRSRLSLAQEGVPNEMQAECILGWNQSFDKLDAYLAQLKS